MSRVRSIILSCVLLGLNVACLGGCGKAKEAMPDYSADVGVKNVRFAGVIAPPAAGVYNYDGGKNNSPSYITVERYQQIKDAGLSIVIGHHETGINNPNVRTALDCAKEVGIRYMINDQSIVNFAGSSVERFEEAIKEVIEHEGCAGIMVSDEPQSDRFGAFGRTNKLFRQITDKYFYINLLPIGATKDAYPDYLDGFARKVGTNYISMDNYPYLFDGMNYGLRENWLLNLEQMQNTAVKYGLEHWEFLQGNKAYSTSKIPDYYDLSHNIYSAMCFGTQVFNYYCYSTPAEFGPDEQFRCMIDYYGEETDIYRAAKTINHEILDFGHVYMNFNKNWQGVLTYVGSENTKESNSAFNLLQTSLKQHDRIKSVTCSQDTVVGAFKDANDYDGFVVMNYSIPGLRLKSDVAVTFNDATKAVVYVKGKETVVDLKNGKLDLELDAGEGVFVIPVNH